MNPSCFNNKSCIFGIGCGFLLILLFTSLKSLMKRTVPSFFGIINVGIEGRRACGGERVLDGLWATYIPGTLGAARPAHDCNGGIGCARAAGVGRDEHTLTPVAGEFESEFESEFEFGTESGAKRFELGVWK